MNIHLGQLKKKFETRTKKELQDISSLEIEKGYLDEKIRKLIYDELLPFLPKIKESDKCIFCKTKIPKTQIICNKCDNGKYNLLKKEIRKMFK